MAKSKRFNPRDNESLQDDPAYLRSVKSKPSQPALTSKETIMTKPQAATTAKTTATQNGHTVAEPLPEELKSKVDQLVEEIKHQVQEPVSELVEKIQQSSKDNIAALDMATAKNNESIEHLQKTQQLLEEMNKTAASIRNSTAQANEAINTLNSLKDTMNAQTQTTAEQATQTASEAASKAAEKIREGAEATAEKVKAAMPKKSFWSKKSTKVTGGILGAAAAIAGGLFAANRYGLINIGGAGSTAPAAADPAPAPAPEATA